MTVAFATRFPLPSVLLALASLFLLGCRPTDRSVPNETANALAPASPRVVWPTETHTVAAMAEPLKIRLGTPELTAGIPGEGELTAEQIQAWLADPENHRPILPELPPGLAAAQANIQGLEANPLTKAKIELGRQLYFDPRLSADGTVSCATCHDPDAGYGAHTQFGEGIGAQTGNRNSPVSYNRILSGAQFWDGRALTLEAQAVGPIENPIEMGNTHAQAVAKLKEIPGYQQQFTAVFPAAGATIETVGQALAAFERVLVTDTAPYDYYETVRTMEQQLGDEIEFLQEDDPELYARYQAAVKGSSGMSESAKRGRELFFADRVGCTACHAGANFTDELYHNLGVGMEVDEPDWGRYEVTKQDADRGAFKTPTLRNVALSAPYMHDGSQNSLEEVMQWYVKGGHPNPYLSDKVKKLDLTDQEVRDIVAFMEEGLTSDFPKVRRDRLPQ